METELLRARISDTADICEKTQRPKFFGFLSPEQAVLANQMLSKRNINFSFYGGYDDAQRVILGCFPDWADDISFPITAISFSFRKADVLKHKDFLGSLMALGIKREAVGDILVESGRAIAFLSDDIADYVLNEVNKIGRTGVELCVGYKEPLPNAAQLKEFSETVSSLRLDCVVAALAGVSRNEAEQKIKDGFVSVNSVTVQKLTKTIGDGDIVTVRSSGKFIVSSTTERSKKDRVILKYKKYI